MPRNIPVGNGKLLVTFDDDYCLRDIYFPCIGKENHTDGRKCRFGIWVDGKFSWVNKDWNPRLEYIEESLVTQIKAINKEMGIELNCHDLVDYEENLYIKKVCLKNLAAREREIRLFFHHDLNILESPAANTAYYDPDEKAIIHYKEKRYFLMSGMRNDRQGIDQYATGIKDFHGLEGTWRDAEDGQLEGNPIAQGSIDSSLGFTVKVQAQGEETIYYWICAGEDYSAVNRLNKMIKGHGLEHFTERTNNYWQAWVNKEDTNLTLLPPPIQKLYKKSLLILQTNIDFGGAIIAGTDSDLLRDARDTYSYMWPRDGALTAYTLDRAGYQGIARQFFEFCFDIIHKGKESLGGYFLHKYNPDGSLGSSWHPWVNDQQKILPIQEDGTALILWSLWLHFKRYKDIEFIVPLYEQMVKRCGDFLASYRDDDTWLPLPSYDLWEEKWGIHTFTVSAVYAGLKAAENFADFFNDAKRKNIYARASSQVKAAMEKYLYSSDQQRFLKTIVPRRDGSFETDLAVDASMYAPFYFGVFEAKDERMANTMAAIKNHLWVKTQVGGIARYEGDSYYRVSDNMREVPGNPWFICTLWLAQWYIAKATNHEELLEAMSLLDWVASRALPSGVLAEQIHPYSGKPLSVTPLTWSHATFVATVLEYLDKEQNLANLR